MPKNRILLIEDNLEMRENTAEILELSDYEVETAENGKIGLEKAKEVLPDLIICDIMMPEMDGYRVLHLLGKKPETASIPFIFLTAKADKSDFRRGMELGADDYLTKPYDEMQLINAVESRLKKAEILKKKYSESTDKLDDFLNDAKAQEQLENLSNAAKVKFFNKKEVIYLEESHPKALFFLKKGKVKLYKSNEDGREFITRVVNEGDFFGYIALLQNTTHPNNAVALEKSEIAIISKEDFNDLMFKNHYVSSIFIKMMSNNIEENEERLLSLAYQNVRSRVAQAILDIYKNSSDKEGLVKISREDLASIVGTSTESTIRTISDFKEDQLIEIIGRSISIKDPQGLKNIVSGFM